MYSPYSWQGGRVLCACSATETLLSGLTTDEVGWVNKSSMWKGLQSLQLERNVSLCFNLQKEECLIAREISLWWSDWCWFYLHCVSAKAVLGMGFLLQLIKLINSPCHLVPDTGPRIFHDAEAREYTWHSASKYWDTVKSMASWIFMQLNTAEGVSLS